MLAASFSCILIKITWRHSSGRSQMFLKIGILKYFANFTRKQLRWNFFLINLKALSPATLLKKSPTQWISCEICEIFKKTFFYSAPRLLFKISNSNNLFKDFLGCLLHNKSLIICYLNNDKLTWKYIHLSNIVLP